MSRPKRLPENEYALVVTEVEAKLRKFLPQEIPSERSVTRLKSLHRARLARLLREPEGFMLRWDDLTEAQKESREPVTMPLEIDEKLCRELVSRAEAGDRQADTDLRSLAIPFLDAFLEGRNNAFAPDALLRYVRDSLEHTLPYDKDQLRYRQLQIAIAVDTVLKKLPGIMVTRNQASRTEQHPESACSLVAKALANFNHAMSENNVRKAWEAFRPVRVEH